MEANEKGSEKAFRDDLRRLIHSLDPDRRLTLMGRRGLQSLLEEATRHGRQVAAACERHPEIAGVAITRPVFIVGMPRTGTTFLQNLLSRDPDCRWLAPWELDLPFPGKDIWGSADDPRRRAYERSLKKLRRRHAELDAIHPVDSPAECWRLLVPTFVCHTLFLFFGFGGYGSWAGDLGLERVRAAYEQYRRQLQHLAWYRPGSHFVLKAPEHAFNLPALLDVFPDARIVLLHRDPLKVVPSFCSLAWRCQYLCVRNPRPAELGREVLAVLARCGEKIIAARRSLNPECFYDIHYQELVRDPLGVAARIYAHFDMPFEGAALPAMTRWLEEQGKTPRLRHRYDSGDFALSPHDIDRAFAGYCDYFEIAPEPAA